MCGTKKFFPSPPNPLGVLCSAIEITFSMSPICILHLYALKIHLFKQLFFSVHCSYPYTWHFYGRSYVKQLDPSNW